MMGGIFLHTHFLKRLRPIFNFFFRPTPKEKRKLGNEKYRKSKNWLLELKIKNVYINITVVQESKKVIAKKRKIVQNVYDCKKVRNNAEI